MQHKKDWVFSSHPKLHTTKSAKPNMPIFCLSVLLACPQSPLESHLDLWFPLTFPKQPVIIPSPAYHRIIGGTAISEL